MCPTSWRQVWGGTDDQSPLPSLPFSPWPIYSTLRMMVSPVLQISAKTHYIFLMIICVDLSYTETIDTVLLYLNIKSWWNNNGDGKLVFCESYVEIYWAFELLVCRLQHYCEQGRVLLTLIILASYRNFPFIIFAVIFSLPFSPDMSRAVQSSLHMSGAMHALWATLLCSSEQLKSALAVSQVIYYVLQFTN